jgi:hypothetical protein
MLMLEYLGNRGRGDYVRRKGRDWFGSEDVGL